MTARSGAKLDGELASSLLHGDSNALASVYDQYGALVYSVMLRITRDPAVAEDLTQDVFLRVWTRIDDFNSHRGTLGVWIVSIARNLAIDFVRSTRTRSGLLQAQAYTAEPNQRSYDFEAVELVRRTFAALTISQRQLLEMAYFEGCSQSEIAARLQTPLGTIKSRMRAAIQQFRDVVDGATGTAAVV